MLIFLFLLHIGLTCTALGSSYGNLLQRRYPGTISIQCRYIFLYFHVVAIWLGFHPIFHYSSLLTKWLLIGALFTWTDRKMANLHGNTMNLGTSADISVGLRIKCPLAPSIWPEWYSWTGKRGVLQLGIRAKVLGSIPLSHVFSIALIPPSLVRSPYGGALLSTYMVRARGYGSHAIGGMLDWE
jgi:hypothetical protein